MNDQNLSDVMHGFLDAEHRAAEAAAPDTAAETHALAHRIGRRRAVRSAGIGLASALVLGAVAVGVNALERPEPPLPATPSPTATVAPAPTPTPEPEPEPSTPAPTPTTPVAHAPADLSTATPLPPGGFAGTEEGWMLLQVERRGSSTTPVYPQPVYLVSLQDGTVYSVPLPDDLSDLSILGWTPGTGLVLGADSDFNGNEHLVDLASGTSTGVPGLIYDSGTIPDGSGDVLLSYAEDGLSMHRVRPDGQTVFAIRLDSQRTDMDTLVSADGSWVAQHSTITGPDLFSLATGEAAAMVMPYPGTACRASTWVDDSALLTYCTPGGTDDVENLRPGRGPQPELWLMYAGGKEPIQLAESVDMSAVVGAWRVGDQVVVQRRDDQAFASTWLRVGPGGLIEMSTTPGGAYVLGVLGDELVVQVRTDPTFGSDGSTVVALDPTTGGTRTLIDLSDGPAVSSFPESTYLRPFSFFEQ